MEPIQLQCGSCGKTMGINPAHLGAQVHCPHCQAIVQTPAPAGAFGAASGGAAPAPNAQPGEMESIFSQPEPTDDLFGGGSQPRVEMPPELPPPPPMYAIQAADATIAMEPEERPQPSEEETATSPFLGAAANITHQAAPAEQDLGALTPQRRFDDRGGLFMPILLIFLVPYAIFTTAFIAYLLYTWPKDNPLKNLPDIGPRGQPRLQVKHDLPLDKDMKTALGQPIQVGDIKVTPLKVRLTPEQDLVLEFKAKNMSTNVSFNPIADEYMRYSKKSMDSGRPYTYLERVSGGNLNKVYGGDLEWFKGSNRVDSDMEIGPGEEAVIHLATDVYYRTREVPAIVKGKEPLVWRVQVRRGLVEVDGKGISATTVIGVEFTSRDIVKDRGG